MSNSVRGTTEIMIAGTAYEVGFTLGAVARLAKVFGVTTFAELRQELVRFELDRMPAVVQAILQGNGYMDVTVADIERMSPEQYFELLATGFDAGAARKPADDKGEAAEGNAKSPVKRSKAS